MVLGLEHPMPNLKKSGGRCSCPLAKFSIEGRALYSEFSEWTGINVNEELNLRANPFGKSILPESF
jgi:hypothetical protein